MPEIKSLAFQLVIGHTAKRLFSFQDSAPPVFVYSNGNQWFDVCRIVTVAVLKIDVERFRNDRGASRGALERGRARHPAGPCGTKPRPAAIPVTQ